MSASTQVLSVRVSPRERELLSMAAENEHTNLSDFIRRKAVEAAEMPCDPPKTSAASASSPTHPAFLGLVPRIEPSGA
jgi:hypothetical protein